jgi:hypothetical protein
MRAMTDARQQLDALRELAALDELACAQREQHRREHLGNLTEVERALAAIAADPGPLARDGRAAIGDGQPLPDPAVTRATQRALGRVHRERASLGGHGEIT